MPSTNGRGAEPGAGGTTERVALCMRVSSEEQRERETIRERTRAGIHRAFRNGRHFGAAPYGYRADKQGYLRVVEEEAEIVREIIGRVAEGSSLYAETKRLNGLGIPTPGWRYSSGKTRPGAAAWTVRTVSNIVHQTAYSGTHQVKIKKADGDKDTIEQMVPPILSEAAICEGLQERAAAALKENKRYPDRKNSRRYLLRGLIKCAECGGACTGHPATSRGRKWYYYICRPGRPNQLAPGTVPVRPHSPAYVNAEWVEDLVWADVRRFLENPGEVLERVREQSGTLDAAEADRKTEERRKDLAKRLAGRQAEKDRYIRTYAQGHISEVELAVYLADLKNQTDNLRMLLTAVEAEISQQREQEQLADTTEVWLRTLRERIEEVEGDTLEAFQARQRLVKLLVQSISAGKHPEDERVELQITYRFGPPPAESPPDELEPALPTAPVVPLKNGSLSYRTKRSKSG